MVYVQLLFEPSNFLIAKGVHLPLVFHSNFNRSTSDKNRRTSVYSCFEMTIKVTDIGIKTILSIEQLTLQIACIWWWICRFSKLHFQFAAHRIVNRHVDECILLKPE